MSSKAKTTKIHNQLFPTKRSLLFNIASLIICGRGLFKCTQLILPPSLSQAGHKQFLTNLSLVATLISNILNILNWFIQRSSMNNIHFVWNYICRHFVLPIALTLETIVPVIYWPLRLFAQKLIMQDIPKNEPYPLSTSTDLSIHLFPFIFLFSDHYFSGFGSKFEISNTKAWFIVSSLGFGYFKYLSFLIDPAKGQVYPYPFLDVEEPMKTIIFIVVSTVAWLFFILYQTFPPHTSVQKSNKIKNTKSN